jgi:hypothetical protein
MYFSSSSFRLRSSFWIPSTALRSSTFSCCCCRFTRYCSSFFFISRLFNSANNISSALIHKYPRTGSGECPASRPTGCYARRPTSTASGPGPPYAARPRSAKTGATTSRSPTTPADATSTTSATPPVSPYAHGSARESTASPRSPACTARPRSRAAGPVAVWVREGVLAENEGGEGLLAEGSQFLLDLVVNLDSAALVLPLRELRLVELLLQLRLHTHQLVLLRTTLVNQLLGTTARSCQHRCYRNIITL